MNYIRCSDCRQLTRNHNDGDPRCSSCAESGDTLHLALVLANDAERFVWSRTSVEDYDIKAALIYTVRSLVGRVEELESSLSLADSDAMVRAQEGD